MDARIVARECLTECSQTRLLLPGISPLSLLLLLLVTVRKKGGKAIEPTPVPSVSKAVVHGVGGFLWCPHCYLVPIDEKSYARKSPRGLSAVSFLYSFASLPNLTLTLGRQWVEASAWRTRPELPSLPTSLCPWKAPTCQGADNCSSVPGRDTLQILCLSNTCLNLGVHTICVQWSSPTTQLLLPESILRAAYMVSCGNPAKIPTLTVGHARD